VQAPNVLFDELVTIGLASRKVSRDPDVRWARALLWALGPRIPERLYEAAQLVASERGRDLIETAWRRLEGYATELGLL